jgi:hypothetical protein
MDKPSANANVPAAKFLIDLGKVNGIARKRFIEIICPFLKTFALVIPNPVIRKNRWLNRLSNYREETPVS